jgi:hypothetical protein
MDGLEKPQAHDVIRMPVTDKNMAFPAAGQIVPGFAQAGAGVEKKQTPAVRAQLHAGGVPPVKGRVRSGIGDAAPHSPHDDFHKNSPDGRGSAQSKSAYSSDISTSFRYGWQYLSEENSGLTHLLFL